MKNLAKNFDKTFENFKNLKISKVLEIKGGSIWI